MPIPGRSQRAHLNKHHNDDHHKKLSKQAQNKVQEMYKSGFDLKKKKQQT